MPDKREPPDRESRWHGPEKTLIHLKVNGRDHELFVEPRRTLLDALRIDLGLTGTKRGCNEGTCGACTVLVGSRPLYACMALAIDYDGQSIATIEFLERNGELHLIQKAFIEEDGLQCGFCTPGQVMAAKSLLDRKPNPTPAEIRRFMAGNLCRCGAYPKIVRAVLRAAQLLSAGA